MFTFTIDGWDKFNRMVRGLLNYWDAPHGEMKVLAEELARMFERTFHRGGPKGKRWRQHSNYTRVARGSRLRVARGGATTRWGGGSRKVGYYGTVPRTKGRGTTLVWSGSMLDALIGRLGEVPPKGKHLKGGTHTRRVQRGCLELLFGSTDPLLMIHHEGAKIQKPRIEAKGRALTIIGKDGGIVFRKSAGPATIEIPARPLYTKAEVEEAMERLGKRMSSKTVEIWGSG